MRTMLTIIGILCTLLTAAAFAADNKGIISDSKLVMQHLRSNIVLRDDKCADETIQYRYQENAYNSLWFTANEQEKGLDKEIPKSEDEILIALRQNLQMAPWSKRNIKSVEFETKYGNGFWRIEFCQ